MRPPSQAQPSESSSRRRAQAFRRAVWIGHILASSLYLSACGGGASGSTTSPPPPAISVNVTPTSGSVLLGETLSFSATVSNTTNTAVSWSVNGVPGGSAEAGTISVNGVYTAPGDLLSGGAVQVTATSRADPTKSAGASVSVTSDISIAISPSVSSVELGALQAFHATITSNGKPDQTIRWSLFGPACPSNCGAVDSNGNYTAPQILPSAPNLSIIATSVADPSKQVIAPVTITSHFTLQLSAPSSLQTGAMASVVATLTPVPGSSPSNVLTWSLSGTGCTGSACGVLSVVTTQDAGATPIADAATYTAPLTAPQPNLITITATPLADPSKQAQVSIIIEAGMGLGLSPSTYTLAITHRITLTVTENGTSGASLSWSVNGVPGGNTTLGQVCVVDSSPCEVVTSGTATRVDYVAPGAMPATNPVSVRVSSTGNPALSAAAQITVINHIVVSILPNSVTLAPLGVQGFAATVIGTTNVAVTWEIQGSGCVSSGVCGSINFSGTYTAPAAAPSPDAIQIVAQSQDDSTQSGAANVTISSGANILTLHPASVYAGSADGFTLGVDGSGFVVSSPGPGSTLLIGGAARVTTCSSVNFCTAAVNNTDVAQPGNVNVQIRNPDGSLSNAVSLVVVEPGVITTVVTLSTAAPASTGQDIIVVEPTTAGEDDASVSFDLNVAALGVFDTSTNSCNLGGNPIPLTPPAGGTSAADICLFSQSGFDTSMSYVVSGPGDVAVITKQPAGLGIIHLTIQIPSTAAAGARTLFIQDANLDETAASGALEIQ